ncbi:hypothetical protein ACVB8X_28200 [Streptomyces sp. NRAIS4]
MAVDRLPGGVREFVSYLDGLLARLDRGGGWSGVFWQRDPDGMRACLDGREVPPWDVVEALLEDLAGAYGSAAAEAERERARALYRAALAAYDARPGARDTLLDRLDVMLREQRYAAERHADLTRLLTAPTSAEEADSLRLDLAWAQDDHVRATARCAELRSRLTELDRHGAMSTRGPVHGADSGPLPVEAEDPEAAGGSGTSAGAPPDFGGVDRGDHMAERGRRGVGDMRGGVAGPARGTGGESAPAGRGTSAGAPPDFGGVARDRAQRPTGSASGYGPPHAQPADGSPAGPETWTGGRVPDDDRRRVASYASEDFHPAGFPAGHPIRAQATLPHGIAAPAQDPHAVTAAQPSHADGSARTPHAAAPAPAPRGAASGSTPHGSTPAPASHATASASAPYADGPARPPHPVAPPPAPHVAAPDHIPHAPAHAVPPTPEAPKARKRRRGSARFAGMVEEEAASVVVPQVAPPVMPEGSPRGARFAGVAAQPGEAGPAGEVVDGEAWAAAAGVVERLARLRAEGRSGEAHVLLVEVAQWPAGRFPALADALYRAGLDADWATLLWEAVSLPAERLVAAADALAAAGRDADGRQLLRQGVARPAEQIGEAVLRLEGEGRRREAEALLDAYVRVRTAEEAARSVVPDPRRLVPLLLRAAQAVSDERHWDLVHALRVAGHAT